MKLRQYFFFTLISGTLIGVFSTISDTLPYQDSTFYDTALRFVAELLNDTITWLGLSIVVGCLFCRSANQAALMGGGFAVFSIIIYFLLSLFVPEQTLHNGGSSVMAVAEWLLAAAVGGAAGGLIGLATKKYPSALLLFVAFIAIRLILRETTWQNAAGIAENVAFIAIAAVSVVWLIRKRRSFGLRPS